MDEAVAQQQQKTIKTMLRVRSELGDVDLLSNSEFLSVAWEVVVVHEPLIHFVLRRSHLRFQNDGYEDAAAYLRERFISTVCNYEGGMAKFSTYAITNLQWYLLIYFRDQRFAQLPFYMPRDKTEAWIADTPKRLEKRRRALHEARRSELLSFEEHRKKIRSLPKSSETAVKALYNWQARRTYVARRKFGEAGEGNQFEVDPLQEIPSEVDVENEVVDSLYFAQLYGLLYEVLSRRERVILCLYYGLTPDRTRFTYEGIGQYFDLTRERIRQIVLKSLDKLRFVMGERGFYD